VPARKNKRTISEESPRQGEKNSAAKGLRAKEVETPVVIKRRKPCRSREHRSENQRSHAGNPKKEFLCDRPQEKGEGVAFTKGRIRRGQIPEDVAGSTGGPGKKKKKFPP